MCRGQASLTRLCPTRCGVSLSGLPDDRLRRVLGAETADMARLMPDLADRFEALGERAE